MARRTRDMTPWPLATPEQAAQYTIERVRTNAGHALAVHGVPLEESVRRVEVRIEEVRVDDTGEATGIVHTRVDGGAWMNEGGYLLSKRMRH